MHEYSFIVMGDMPYEPEHKSKFALLVDAINARAPRFVVHLGDLKKGKSPCTDECFADVKEQLDRVRAPLIFTPGDNDWIDCREAVAGGYRPDERLAHLRNLFFSSEQRLRDGELGVARQREFVENSSWTIGNTVFVTLHTVGKGNNYEDEDEFQARNQANLDWLRLATAVRTERLVLFTHANIWVRSGKKFQKGYRGLIKMLKDLANDGRKVLVVHGDKHDLIIDQPPLIKDAKSNREGLLRIQVMGDDDVRAVEVRTTERAHAWLDFRIVGP